MSENDENAGHLAEAPPMDINYFEDIDAGIEVSENSIERLTALAKESTNLAKEVSDMEVELAEKQERLKSINRVSIPNMMDELGMKDFTLTDGSKIEVQPKVNASIAVANKPEAYKWLHENDYDGIIKTKVTASFGRGEADDAAKAIETLREAGYDAALDESIHPATLTSFVKERLEAGDVLPQAFSVFEFREAKIKLPKPKKTK